MKRRKSVFAPERELSLDELLPNATGETRSVQVPDGRELPDEQVLRSELNSELERAMRELPEIYRSAVLLRDVEGLSTAEAADVLDLSEDTLKQRLHRGRLALRKSLAGYLEVAQ
jgi:RNA polymerase sigma-70 factor, ECF subfamily